MNQTLTLSSDFDARASKIEAAIASDEMNEATKLLMDLVKDFSADDDKKQESIVIRRAYNALKQEVRQFGNTDETRRLMTKVVHQVLQLIRVIREEHREPVPISPFGGTDPVVRTAMAPATPPNERNVPPGQGGSSLASTLRPRRRQASAAALPAPDTDVAFQGNGLTKSRRVGTVKFTLHPIDVVLKFGQITALVGENGNGKTTLLRIIAGELKADGGELSYPALGGQGSTLYAIRGQIGYMPQDLIPWSGSVADNLHFCAAVHGLRGKANEAEVEFVLLRLGLERYSKATWNELSGGFKMRFELARLLLSRPRLLIMDEPLANLDVSTQSLFLDDIRELVKSATFPMAAIISSQHLHEVEAIADRIIFLKEGEALYNGEVTDFGEDRDENAYELSCRATREELADLFEPLAGATVTGHGRSFLVSTARGVDKKTVLQLLLSRDISIEHFRDISKSTRKLFEVDL